MEEEEDDDDIHKSTHDRLLFFSFMCSARDLNLQGVGGLFSCSVTVSFIHSFPSRPQSIDYLRSVAGCRTVPVEVGSRYTDEEWSQTLLTVDEFIDRYVVNKASARKR